jgi:uncharacterized protein (TIGR04255 family)
VALKFIEHPDVVFRKAPLVTVLSQIRFEPVLSLMSEVGIAGFQEGLRHVYPHLRCEQSGQIEIGGESSGINRIGIKQAAPIWRMTDDQNSWRVSLAVDFVAVEAPRYRDFDEFLNRLMLVLDVLDRTVNVGDSTRIGLRKINLLDPPAISSRGWLEFLRPELLAIAGAPIPGLLAQSMSELLLQDGLAQLLVRYGFISKEAADVLADSADLTKGTGPQVMNVPVSDPSGLNRIPTEAATQFVIDLDYSTIAPYPARGGDDMAEVLKEFSDGMTSFFHWAITPTYYEWLEPEPRMRGNHVAS